MDMKITKMGLPKLTLLASLLIAGLSSANAADLKLDGIAAVVNNDVVLTADVEALSKRNRESGNLDDDKTLFQKSLNTLILESLQLQEAKRLGISPSTADVDKATLSVAARNNMDLGTFTQALAERGMNLPDFKRNIAKQMTISALKRRQPEKQAASSEQDVSDLLSAETNQVSRGLSYNIQDILIPAAQPLSNAKYTQASRNATQLRRLALTNPNFLSTKIADSKAEDLGWKESSQLSYAYLKELNSLEKGQVSKVIQDARGFHVLKLVEKRGGTNDKAYEVQVRHILVAKNEANAQSKANQILQQLKKGADFATLARINSADKGSAINGGDLGWSDSRKFVSAFSKATETLALNTVSPLVQTEFGYHIIEVLDRKVKADDQRQLEAKAKKALAERNNTSSYESWVQSLRTNAFIDYRLKVAK